jgi:hypothetical protein
MSALSITLNILTVLLVIVTLFFQGHNVEVKEEGVLASAMEIMRINAKDPRVTSRAYFTEPRYGNIGKFTNYDEYAPIDNYKTSETEESRVASSSP